MPANHGVGLDDDQRVDPARPDSEQSHPEAPVGIGQFRPGFLVLQNGELLTESQVFEDEIRAGSEESTNSDGFDNEANHRDTMLERPAGSKSE